MPTLIINIILDIVKMHQSKIAIDYDRLIQNIKITPQQIQDTQYQHNHVFSHQSNAHSRFELQKRGVIPIIYDSIVLDDYEREDCFMSVCQYQGKSQSIGAQQQFRLYDENKQQNNKQNMRNTTNMRYLSHTETSQKKFTNKKFNYLSTTASHKNKRKQLRTPKKNTIKKDGAPAINQITRKYYKEPILQ